MIWVYYKDNHEYLFYSFLKWRKTTPLETNASNTPMFYPMNNKQACSIGAMTTD
jgi:hypothetical protein